MIQQEYSKISKIIIGSAFALSVLGLLNAKVLHIGLNQYAQYVADRSLAALTESAPITNAPSTPGACPATSPVIRDITPDNAPVNSPDTLVTINGSGFASAASVNLNLRDADGDLVDAIPLRITSLNDGQIIVNIPSNNLRTYDQRALIQVMGPPGCGNSGEVIFKITKTRFWLQFEGAEVGDTLSFAMYANGRITTKRVESINGVGNGVDVYNVSPGTISLLGLLGDKYYVNRVECVIGLAGSAGSGGGTPTGNFLATTRGMSNIALREGRNTFCTFYLEKIVVPTIASISPNSVRQGYHNSDVVMRIAGENFIAPFEGEEDETTSIVKMDGTILSYANQDQLFDGTEVDTEFLFNSTELYVVIPSSLTTAAGTHTITVTNPGVTGGTSNSVTFTVTADSLLPHLTTVSPNSGGASSILTLAGTGFSSSSVVQIIDSTGNLHALRSLRSSATELVVVIDPATAQAIDNRIPSMVSIEVVNCNASRCAASDNKPFTMVLTYFGRLTVIKAGSGSGKVTSNPLGITCGTTCESFYTQGTSVTLTATAASGSKFMGWDGACTNKTGPCVTTMDASKTVTATFINTTIPLELKVDKAGSGLGTVVSSPAGINCGETCAKSYAGGSVVTLTAKPSITAGGNNRFAGWSGACTNATGTCVVTMDDAKNVTATFTFTTVGQ